MLNSIVTFIYCCLLGGCLSSLPPFIANKRTLCNTQDSQSNELTDTTTTTIPISTTTTTIIVIIMIALPLRPSHSIYVRNHPSIYKKTSSSSSF